MPPVTTPVRAPVDAVARSRLGRGERGEAVYRTGITDEQHGQRAPRVSWMVDLVR